MSGETALLQLALSSYDPLSREAVDVDDPRVDPLAPFIGFLIAAAIGSLLWVVLVLLVRLVV